jgi:hypothetical protein
MLNGMTVYKQICDTSRFTLPAGMNSDFKTR